MPKVTIIYPSIRNDWMSRIADNSIKYQTLKDIEVIKIDDPNIGGTRAANMGLDKANGELVTWMFDDDVALLEKCEILAMYADKYPDYDVFYSSLIIINEKNKFTSIYNPPRFDINFFIRFGNFFSLLCTAIRREKIGDVRFRKDYPLTTEYLFFYELHKKGLKFKQIGVPLVFSRAWKTQKTVRRHYEKVREHERLRTEFGDDRFYRNRVYTKEYLDMVHKAEQEGGVVRKCPR